MSPSSLNRSFIVNPSALCLPCARVFCLLADGLLLSACGGGGGGDAHAPPSPPPPVEVAQAAITRASDGFDVQVTPYRMSNAATAAPTRVEVRIVNSADPARVASLTAAFGKDHDAAAALTAAPTGTGVWSLTWPAGVAPDSGLLLTLVLQSEDVFETGLTDFHLNR